MRILITGGCGFIGTNFVRYLLTHTDDSVINLDKLTYAANTSSLADMEDRVNYSFIHGDIADANVVGQVINQVQPDAIMNFAAESHVDRSIDGPGEFILTNIVGTFNLLDAGLEYWQKLPSVQQASFRFLHVSTDEVYGSLGREGRFTEESRYDPHSPYAASKASSDHLVRAWHDTYGLPVLVTNCSNNYGPFQFPEKLIPLAINRALNCETIPVYGKGENVRDWLYVEDHVRALHRVLQQGKTGHTYNIGGNNERRNIDLIHDVCAILDELSPVDQNPRNANLKISSYANLITFVADRPGHDQRYAIDASKIEREIGWSPTEDPVSGLRKTVQWYLDNQTWTSDILDKKYRMQRLGLASRPRFS